MKIEKYYQVQCDDAPNPDKMFLLKDVEDMFKYLKKLNKLEYEVYFMVWNPQTDELLYVINVTEEFTL
jgi:hypothetical protein